MKPNLFIKYHGTSNPENDSEVDLVTLGNSIIGFDEVIKEILKISKIKGNISVSATKVRQWSLIVDLALQIAFNNSIPFDNIGDFLNFLKLVDLSLWKTAHEFFSAIDGTHRLINDFASKNPFDYDLITYYIVYMIWEARWQKKSINTEKLPPKYAEWLNRMIKKKKFQQALKPIVENEVSSVEMSSDKNFSPKKTTTIDERNFESYLSEDEEQILPHFEDWKSYRFTATIVGMQCTHGDSMKVRIHGFHKKYRDLVAFPESEKDTEDYRDFYWKDKNIILEARVERKSLYQKPKLHIESISLQNEPIFKWNK